MGRVPSDLVVLTFNILCPVYKRLGPEHGGLRRESESTELWKPRMAAVIAEILACTPIPDVICLQEFWFNPECVQIFRNAFAASYTFFLAKRPGKEDGLATLIRKSSSAFLSTNTTAILPTATREFSLLPGSDRVALLVALRLAPPALCSVARAAPPGDCISREIVIVNTHLTFPHGPFLHRLRLEQARSLSRAVSMFAAKKLAHPQLSAGCDALILGDFNGDPRSRVCTHLRHAGYSSCLVETWGEAREPATHRNHLGESVFVDHVFLRRFFPDAMTSGVPRAKLRLSPLRFLKGREKALRHASSSSSLRGGAALCDRLHRRRAPFRKSRRTLTSGAAMSVANAAAPDANDGSNENDDYHDDASSLVSGDSVRSATLTHLDADALRSATARYDDVLGGKLSRDKPTSMSMSAIDDGASTLACCVAPVHARVLPDGVATETWPTTPRCSDHRPVVVEFRYSWAVLARKEDDESSQITDGSAADAPASVLKCRSGCK